MKELQEKVKQYENDINKFKNNENALKEKIKSYENNMNNENKNSEVIYPFIPSSIQSKTLFKLLLLNNVSLLHIPLKNS